MVIELQRLAVFILASVLNAGVVLAAPAFFPARMGDDGAVRRVALVSDCRVHVALKNGGEELHLCAARIALPSEAHLVWIEQGENVSGQIAPPAGSEDVDLPLVAAGAIQLEMESVAGDAQRTVRLLNAGSIPFARTIRAGKSGQRLRMPQGTSVALELEGRGDVSRFAIAKIVPGRVTTVKPILPAKGAAVVGIFTIPTIVPEREMGSFLLDGKADADLVVNRGSEVVTLWSALDGGSRELALRSDTYHFAPASLRLRERNVFTIRGELRPLPSLTVTIDVPEDAVAAWRELNPSLTIRRTADKKNVRQSEAAIGEQLFSFLPPDSYDAVLTTSRWTFVRRGDLTGGDAAVHFRPEPFTIAGRVTAGGEPVLSTITFRRGNGDTTTVRSDAAGEYEATLWMSDMYIVETSRDENPSQPPFSRAVRLSSTRRLDIQVPSTKVRVHVTDAASGKPVANAEVTTLNRWNDPQSGKGTTSHAVKTDARGIAELAPLSRGTAEIHVKADGYFKDDPAIVEIQDDRMERTIPVSVRPAGESSVLSIVLPDGSPTPDADVIVVSDVSGRQMLWSGKSDARGRVNVPRSLAGSIVLVRHPAAASAARRFTGSPEENLALAIPSPHPLIVKVERRGEPARNAAMTVWYAGLPLSGTALQFVLGVPAVTSIGGLWSAPNLPREPVRILASSGTIDAVIATGAYDALVTVVPESRPNQLTLEVVD
jgi:hypothetical protein